MHSVTQYKLLLKKIFFIFIVLSFASTHLLAGSFNSPAPVTDFDSKMYTIEDIYNRLESGAAGTNPNTKNTFAEPIAAPASSSKDLNDVMSKAPAVDDTTGATTDEVINGKKFWSLNSGVWGVQTGTGIIANGNASDADVLAGKTYSNDSGNRTGSMVNATQNITPGNAEKTINAGYHDGTGKVATDANLTANNIKNGSTLFGVTGNYTGTGANVQNTSSGDAIATDILSGKKAWVDGNEITGNVPLGANITGVDGLKTLTINNALYSGAKIATFKDSDLTAINIKNGMVIFGVTGSYTGIGGNVQDTSTGDAVSANILSGKRAWVEGVNLIGTATPFPSPVPRTSQNKCYEGVTGVSTICWFADSSVRDGQDGWQIRGKAWANPRFTDNNNGTITDNNTGLIWLKDASCADLAGTNADASSNWFVARSAVKALADGNCGLTDNSSAGDWHLPNSFELSSLRAINYSSPSFSDTIGTSQWTEGDPFNGIESSWYWSSTTFAGNLAGAVGINFNYGTIFGLTKTDNHSDINVSELIYVWPVRGRQ